MNFDTEYLQLCSEKTLQANKEGFFLQFAEKVAENVGEKWIEKFGKLKSDNERIRTVYEDEKIKLQVIEFLSNVQEIYRKKCSQTAIICLAEAEKAQKSGNKKISLALYSQSILKDANPNLALLGRAKLLISLNEYSSALNDLQLALKQNLPSQSKFEAFWMSAICYKALKNDQKATISLNLAEKLCTNQKHLSLLRHSMQTKYEPIRKTEKVIPPISERHATYNHASKKMEVKMAPEMGRYLVANEDIQSGEVLVVEKPEVKCLFPEKFGTHCHHCFDRFLAPVGCPDCASVAFCSPKCRDEAINSYHRFECKFLDLLIGSGMSVLSLAALRMITQKDRNDVNQLQENKLFTMCTNEEKRNSEDFLQRTLMSAFLLTCLQRSGYFGNTASVIPTDEQYIVGEILLKSLQILQFNAHEIYETLYTEQHRLNVGKPAYIGIGVYPTVALFNHECYPSVVRYFVGTDIVITSLRPLSPGTQISENYGPVFTHHKLLDRQRLLAARYWFKCQCVACLEDWPVLKNLESFKRLRCPTQGCQHIFSVTGVPKVKCPKCEKVVDLEENSKTLEWCEEQYEIGAKYIEKKEKSKAMDVLNEAIGVFHRISAPPYRPTHQAEANLRAILADFGNVSDSLVKMTK